MKYEDLEVGKRYSFHINNYEDKEKNGLFTGEIDRGNVTLMTRQGEVWSIPVEELEVCKNDKSR